MLQNKKEWPRDGHDLNMEDRFFDIELEIPTMLFRVFYCYLDVKEKRCYINAKQSQKFDRDHAGNEKNLNHEKLFNDREENLEEFILTCLIPHVK